MEVYFVKITGIIAEYNPFHTGHLYHIQQTKKLTDADYIVVALSGDFVQRGAPSCFSKHHRAFMALLGGADLVFELPATHSCQSAEFFAQNGVDLLQGLGCIDYLSFGSETGKISDFQTCGELLAKEPEIYQLQLRQNLKKGLSFPAARQQTVSAFLDCSSDLLSSPNNILGVEYCKALCKRNSPIKPFTIQRKGNGYHDVELQRSFPSATAVRNALQKKEGSDELSSCFPLSVYQYFTDKHLEREFLSDDDFSLVLRWFLYSANPEDFSKYQDLSPELARKILHARNHYENFSQFIALLKTKELTYTRISRALYHGMLNIQGCPKLPYARLLGFRKSAAPILKEIKKKGTLPILTKLASAPSLLDRSGQKILEQNTRISNLYESVLCEKTKKKFIHEYQKEILILP